jgi:NAD+ synthase
MSLNLDCKLVNKKLVGFLAEEFKKANIQNGIVGLSGGIDSALSAYLAVEALGADNVYCIMMPYKSSNPNSQKHAELVIDKLKCNHELIEITPMVEPLFDRDKNISALRKGNIMARERMIILYDYSAKQNGLVIGTGNKTETFLGYSTIFGDTASALNPIGNLYKTQVWQLSKFIGIPNELIDKAPSADLWDGQTDENEFGFSYKEVDNLLYLMIDEKKNSSELIEAGFKPEFIQRVETMIRKSEYKRRLPLVASII